MIYVIADLHFNHQNIIPYENRPFSNLSHMNRTLIDNWNAVVDDDDTVYVLGDFGFTSNIKGAVDCDLKKIYAELKGHKHLIIGNHDRRCRHVTDLPWGSQEKMLSITVDNQRYVMAHYPFECWEYQDSKEGGSIHLHGHIHSNTYMTSIPNRFCVSVEVIDYEPKNITEFAKFKTTPLDRH